MNSASRNSLHNSVKLSIGSTNFTPVILVFFLLPCFCSQGDGCFVFRWNKVVDINEPTQKAIIVYDHGREDLLLQVKYEGPLEDFGWLIPVPSKPEVEKGSMQPFYELSQLTQRQWGPATLSAGSRYGGGDREQVKVIEVKTVGVYQIAVLAANNGESLSGWLKDNSFAVPEGGSAVLDEYTRKGWYFVAAKVQLDRTGAAGPARVPTSSPGQATTRENLQKQMASGELHPIRISFDTPQCIFPLKVSALAKKSSEISLYVLSHEPLMNRLIFERHLEQLRLELNQKKAEAERNSKRNERGARTSMHNSRVMHISGIMLAMNRGHGARDWSLQDLEAIEAEEEFPSLPLSAPPELTDLPGMRKLAQMMEVPASKLTNNTRDLPRLRDQDWHLTKQVCTFAPEQMQDLVLEPAIPFVAPMLGTSEGRAAAMVLCDCGPRALPVVLSACRSTNDLERTHAASILQSFKDPSMVETLLTLTKDPLAQVRHYAVMAMAPNWDWGFIDPLFELLRDSDHQVRWQAAQWLIVYESKDNAPRYIPLLSNPDPDIALQALRVLSKNNRVPRADLIPRADLVRLLQAPRFDVVSLSLKLLQGPNSDVELMRATRPGESQEPNPVSSIEAAPLSTNRLTLARLAGLRILTRNGDADALSLAIPMLHDTNSIVRNRAYHFVCSETQQSFPAEDTNKWESWWAANKATFKNGERK